MKNLLKQTVLSMNRVTARLGVHVTPVHHYSSLPNIAELRNSMDEWRYPSELPGILVDLDAQAENLKTMVAPFEPEFRGNAMYKRAVAEQYGPGYGPIEAQALHGFLRHNKPRHIIEVGSGVSTFCTLEAISKNRDETGEKCSMMCIEPYPYDWLKGSPDVTLMPQRVQAVDVSVYNQLESGDLLFIDSSHTVKPGSDVNHIILEVFPRLKPGVFVHVHDIYFPYDFNRTTLNTFLHWSETSLLRAFLIQNDHVEIVFSLSHLFYERQDVMKRVFPEFDPQPTNNGLRPPSGSAFGGSELHFPSSIYLRTR